MERTKHAFGQRHSYIALHIQRSRRRTSQVDEETSSRRRDRVSATQQTGYPEMADPTPKQLDREPRLQSLGRGPGSCSR